MKHDLFTKLTTLLLCASFMGGCAVAKATGKVAAMPVKGAMKVTEYTGKGIYYTGRGVGKGIYNTGKFAGKGIYNTGKYTGKGIYNTGKYTGKGIYHTGKFTGKTIYYIGKTPIVITDKALDTTVKVLTITTLATDQAGRIIETTKKIQALQLDAELAALKGATGIIKVIVDALDNN